MGSKDPLTDVIDEQEVKSKTEQLYSATHKQIQQEEKTIRESKAKMEEREILKNKEKFNTDPKTLLDVVMDQKFETLYGEKKREKATHSLETVAEPEHTEDDMEE